MRNERWVWPEVRDAGTSGAGAVPLRSAQLMGQQKKPHTLQIQALLVMGWKNGEEKNDKLAYRSEDTGFQF